MPKMFHLSSLSQSRFPGEVVKDKRVIFGSKTPFFNFLSSLNALLINQIVGFSGLVDQA